MVYYQQKFDDIYRRFPERTAAFPCIKTPFIRKKEAAMRLNFDTLYDFLCETCQVRRFGPRDQGLSTSAPPL